MSAPRDPGLQPERTELSWRRTLLSLAAGALVSVRVLPALLGSWTIGAGLTGMAVAGGMWVLAQRRHRVVAQVFRSEAPAEAMPGGALLLVLTAFAFVSAALGLLYVLLSLN